MMKLNFDGWEFDPEDDSRFTSPHFQMGLRVGVDGDLDSLSRMNPDNQPDGDVKRRELVRGDWDECELTFNINPKGSDILVRFKDGEVRKRWLKNRESILFTIAHAECGVLSEEDVWYVIEQMKPEAKFIGFMDH